MPPWNARLRCLLLGVGVLLYFLLLGSRIGAYAGGADSSGYLNHARLLREGKTRIPTRDLPDAPARTLSAFAYVPLGFAPADPGNPTEMVPTYPVGLPLLIAATSWIARCSVEAAAGIVILSHATAGLLLMYLLGRQAGVSRAVSLLGVVMLALSPQYLFGSTQILSDMPALVWVSLAVFLAGRNNESACDALLAGAALAVAVAIRPTNALAFIPIAFALGLRWRRWLAFVAGGLPVAIGLLLYQNFLYGGPLRSGYGAISNEFSPAHAGVALFHYARWLPVLLTPLAPLALAAPWLARDRMRRVAMLALWASAFGGFYAFYSFTHQTWWTLRFVLPAFPSVIVAALLVGEKILQRATNANPARRGWVLFATSMCIVLWYAPWSYRLRALRVGNDQHNYAWAAEWARANLPAKTVVFAEEAGGAIFYYTEFTCVHFSLVTASDVDAIKRAAADEVRPIYAIVVAAEEQRLQREVLPGAWERVQQIGHFAVWRYRLARASP